MRYLIFFIFLNATQVFAQNDIEITLDPNLPDSIQQKYKTVILDVAQPDYYNSLILSNFTFKEPQDMPIEEINSKAHLLINKSMAIFNESSGDFISDISNIYVQKFSQEELNQLSEFFKSDLGKKLKDADALVFNRMIKANSHFTEIKEKNYQEIFEGDTNSKSKKKKKKKK